LSREHPLDFSIRHSVVTAARANGADRALVYPLLEGRIADAEAFCGGAYGEKYHDGKPVKRR
jgi:hypothetical protein